MRRLVAFFFAAFFFLCFGLVSPTALVNVRTIPIFAPSQMIFLSNTTYPTATPVMATNSPSGV